MFQWRPVLASVRTGGRGTPRIVIVTAPEVSLVRPLPFVNMVLTFYQNTGIILHSVCATTICNLLNPFVLNRLVSQCPMSSSFEKSLIVES